jgi:uncharacterized protein
MRRTWAWALCGAAILFALDGIGGVLIQVGSGLPFWGGVFILFDVVVLAGLALWLYSSLVMRRWGRREPTEIVRSDRGPDIGIGVAIGVGFITLCFGIVAVAGGYRVTFASGFGVRDVVDVLTLVVVSAVLEELLFRGVLLQAFERWLGWWPALAITSAFFGAAHLGNPGSTWFGALAIAVEAGFFLGALFLWRRSLWLTIGVHAGWNAAESLFGIPVSGETPHGFLHLARSGSDLLTGGSFGIEASITPMVVGALLGVLVLLDARRHRALHNRRR